MNRYKHPITAPAIAPRRNLHHLDGRNYHCGPHDAPPIEKVHNPSPCCGKPGQIVFVGRTGTEHRCPQCGKTFGRH